MSRRRVAWDGPDPRPGEYLASRIAGAAFLIRTVEPMRRPNAFGERLLLDLVPLALAALPDDAILYPAARAAGDDPAGPPRARQLAPGGPTAVMRAAWRDPDDLRPNSRVAREIRGYRTFCSLRRMMAQGGIVTERHVAAADRFRLDRDLAVIGLSGAREVLPVTALAYGPRAGATDGALAQLAALRAYRRALARFTTEQRQMLIAIVLDNMTLAAWARLFSPPRVPDREMGRLLAILDLLAEHYGSEIDTDLARAPVVVAA